MFQISISPPLCLQLFFSISIVQGDHADHLWLVRLIKSQLLTATFSLRWDTNSCLLGESGACDLQLTPDLHPSWFFLASADAVVVLCLMQMDLCEYFYNHLYLQPILDAVASIWLFLKLFYQVHAKCRLKPFAFPHFWINLDILQSLNILYLHSFYSVSFSGVSGQCIIASAFLHCLGEA